MYKAKIFSFAVACIVGLGSISPVTAFASDTKPESVTVSEKDKNQKDNKAAFDEAMKKANEKWNTLTAAQKAEVYTLIENEMKAEMLMLDKLVQLGVMEKNDVTMLKNRMQERLNQLKKSGQFPFVKQRGTKSSK